MAGLMAGLTIMLILSTVAFQAWSDVLRRDNEAEMIFRAQDLVRAIQRYRRDHGGAGPPKLEQLLESGPKGQYYLRKLWEDPLVADGKWGLLYIGPGGQVIDPSAAPDATGMGGLSQMGGARGLGQGPGGSQGLGGQPSRLNQPGGMQGNNSRSGLPDSPLNRGNSNQLEGLPIAGVKSLCEEKPFRVYNGLTEYSQWLFTYLDLERQTVPGQGQGQGQRQLGGRQSTDPSGPRYRRGGNFGNTGVGFGGQQNQQGRQQPGSPQSGQQQGRQRRR
jgi:type II secretory pathway pseudopilin PulG